MGSPSPVPPYCLAEKSSTCMNLSKSDGILSGGMPMPVSRTEKRSGTVPSPRSWRSTRETSTRTSPSRVNLIALPARLTSICRRRPGSPFKKSGTSGAMKQRKAIPFRTALTLIATLNSSRSAAKSKSRDCSSILPASILERSRMPFRMSSSDSALLRIVAARRRCFASSDVSRSSSVIPSTPFIGVRISWLMAARNSLFAALAASARFLARRSSSSARRRSVMSEPTPRKKSALPSSSKEALSRHSCHRSSPSGWMALWT